MIAKVDCVLIIPWLPDFLEDSSRGTSKKPWGREGWLILQAFGLSETCECSGLAFFYRPGS
jgi:hypothetical protein